MDVHSSYLEQNSVTSAGATEPLFKLPALDQALSLSPTLPVATPAAVPPPVCQSNSPPICRSAPALSTDAGLNALLPVQTKL